MTDTIRQDVRALRRQVADVQEAVRDYVSSRSDYERRLRRMRRRATHAGRDVGEAARRHPAVTGLALLAAAAAVTACLIQYGTRD